MSEEAQPQERQKPPSKIELEIARLRAESDRLTSEIAELEAKAGKTLAEARELDMQEREEQQS